MVDNRSAGFYGIGGAFNFKSGDISGTAAKNQDDKMDSNEYFALQGGEEEDAYANDGSYVDRSAQLRATLNSLAMMNVANVINSKKRAGFIDEKKELDEEFLDDFEEKIYGKTQNREENSDENHNDEEEKDNDNEYDEDEELF